MPASGKNITLTLGGLMLGGLVLGGAIFSANHLMDTTDVATNRAAAEMEAVAEVARSSFAEQENTAWSVKTLRVRFDRVNYDLASIRDGAEVPRLFMDRLPRDLAEVADVQQKKEYFIRTVLPLILAENDRIAEERKLVQSVHDRLAAGLDVDEHDSAEVARIARVYKVKKNHLDELLSRVDEVPVSLALAQAVEESGWGTSRFAREGNALYGQWTTDPTKGILPANRDEGKNHLIRKFDTLSQSVSGYMRNINTHRAYRSLRMARAQHRAQGLPLDGYDLAGHLDSYSERGMAYVDGLRSLMRVNDLAHFDQARLKEAEVALVILQ